MNPSDWLRLLMAVYHGQRGFGSVADWSVQNFPNQPRPVVDVPQSFTGNPWRGGAGTPDGNLTYSGGGAMPLARA